MNGINKINNTQFQGHKITLQQRNKIQQNISLLLKQNINDIVDLTKNTSDKKLYILESLANNFNRNNFYKDMKEDINLVGKIFEKIKKPKDIHNYIIRNFSDSFENLNRIFTATGNNEKKLKFVEKVNEEIFHHDHPKNNTLIPELLESPHIKEYVQHFDDIKSYLKLHKNVNFAVSKLDAKFTNKTFDRKHYDNVLQKEILKASYPFNYETNILNRDIFAKYHSAQNEAIAKIINNNISLPLKTLEAGNDKDIIDIITTTNKKNFILRRNLLDIYMPSLHKNNNAKNTNLTELAKLYKILDSDKYANKFIKNSLPELNYNLNLKDLNDLLNNIPTYKLNIFRKNAWNIISKTQGEERLNTLQNNITNPFFETEFSRAENRNRIKYGFKKRRTILNKTYIKFENYVNKLKIMFFEMKHPNLVNKSNSIKSTNNNVKPNLETQETEKEIIQSKKKTYTKPEINFVNKKIKKQLLGEKVTNFVKTKIGNKTFEKQQEEFHKNATKIRLNMLPEIFASIADTRKTDKLVGKLKSNSANKDVLNLYTKINGNNRKLVNYLLKKRNADKSRMFEVKDIIDIINKAEAKIAKDKKVNPAYRAKDAKAYYNHLYEAKIEQYGKAK